MRTAIGVSKFTAAANLAIAASLVLSSHASATIDAPVPTNAYITLNGLDWAWGEPVPCPSCISAYQVSQGWRLPTADELLMAPLATDFLFAGANVPYQGFDPVSGAFFTVTNSDYDAAQSAGACAAPYFGNLFNQFLQCDWADGNGQPGGPWAGTTGAADLADQLFVRPAQNGAVPEPGTWAMMLLGFGAIGLAFRRSRSTASLRQSA